MDVVLHMHLLSIILCSTQCFSPNFKHLKFICWTRITADASREHQVSVVANFMCQPDQPVCLDYMLFLGVSVTVFLDKISIFISGLSKLLSRMWVGILRSAESLNRTKGRGRKNLPFFSCFTAQLGHNLIFFCPQTRIYTTGFFGSLAFRFKLSYTSFPGSPVGMADCGISQRP